MKGLSIFAGLVLLSLPCLSFSAVSVETNNAVTGHEGAGKTENPFYESESATHLSDLSLCLNKKFSGDYSLAGNLSLRATDDRNIESECATSR